MMDVINSKIEALTAYKNFINNKIFKNHYPLSVGNQILNSSEINYIQELKPALKQFLKHNKKYHYSCLKIADFQHNIILNVNFNAFQIIVRLIDDELIEYNTECHIDNDKIKYMKFITARYNNHDFDNNLASLINSDINIKDLFFRIILETSLEHVPSGSEYAHILEFFNITNSVNVVDALEELAISPKNGFIAELKLLLNESINLNSLHVDFNRILEVDSITNVLNELKATNQDDTINSLIIKAKDFYIKNDLYQACCILWDIYERMKTLLIGNKKQSSELLINVIANKLYNNDSNAEKYTNALLTEEFKCLTEYGNKYTIRHTETDKHDTHNKPELLSYLIKRISALIELCLPYTKKNNNYL